MRKIDSFKTPRDKLISIINCCKIISSIIWKAKKENKNPTGADELLSVLVYVRIKAKPQNIASNISFIGDLREKRLSGEGDYYFTALKSGIIFIENLKANHLKIEPQEYHKLFNLYSEKAKKKLLEEK